MMEAFALLVLCFTVLVLAVFEMGRRLGYSQGFSHAKILQAEQACDRERAVQMYLESVHGPKIRN